MQPPEGEKVFKREQIVTSFVVPYPNEPDLTELAGHRFQRNP